jgi:bifunctional non-homologous end joining protein LigD
MGLRTYRAKRDFARTPEPAGGPAKRAAGGGRFVVQKHDASRLHYDFRLEMDGVLKSWAVPKGPSLDPADKRLAVHVEDHPIEYADFEGVIPEGEYGGGPVIVWDRGRWTPRDVPGKGYAKGHLAFTLDGEKLRGGWSLVRMASSRGDGRNWLLIKADDEAARRGAAAAVTERRPESVKTGRDVGELGAGERVWRSNRPAKQAARAPRARRAARPRARKRSGKSEGGSGAPDPAAVPGARRAALPAEVAPQLATLVPRVPEGDDWVHEIKFDGYRMLFRLEDGRARLLTRSGKDWTARFPSIAAAAAEIPARRALLDGELVVVGPDGRTSFQGLQGALSGDDPDSLRYYAFDLLHLGGWDLERATLLDRKAALRALLGAGRGPVLYSDHVRGQGPDFYRAACARGLEGVVSKRASAPYLHRRTRDWLKTRCSAGQEMVIGGYVVHSADPDAVGALVLGVHDASGRLRYAGRVGTGFDAATRRDLKRRLDALARDDSPFADPVPGRREVVFADPRLVGEVAFTEWTADGALRHPSFRGLREDKAAREVVREAPGPAPDETEDDVPTRARTAKRAPAARRRGAEGGVPPTRPRRDAAGGGASERVAGVALSNPDKVLWPDVRVTKRDLARYYEAVAERMVPYLAGRPLMLLRCPEGVGRPCFFQKHMAHAPPEGVRTVEIEEKSGRDLYLTVDGVTGVVALVQMGALELHGWGSRADRVERPDRIVFDLDPAPEVRFPRVVAAALDVRERLRALGLASFVKTTGGKGLHVEVPIARAHDWDRVKAFSRAFAERMVADAPREYVAGASKALRKGRIFVDWLRNGRGATAVVPYSTRARAGAPVATPLSWDEATPRLDPTRFTWRTVPKRVASTRDPWRDFGARAQRLPRA